MISIISPDNTITRTSKTFEVSFLPDNRVSYSPRLIIDANSLQEAIEFVAERLPDMAGKLEVVRVTTTRHLVAPPPSTTEP